MRVLISGCAYVGSALGLLLAEDGHTVFGLRRNPSNLPPAIHPVVADRPAARLGKTPTSGAPREAPHAYTNKRCSNRRLLAPGCAFTTRLSVRASPPCSTRSG